MVTQLHFRWERNRHSESATPVLVEVEVRAGLHCLDHWSAKPGWVLAGPFEAQIKRS